MNLQRESKPDCFVVLLIPSRSHTLIDMLGAILCWWWWFSRFQIHASLWKHQKCLPNCREKIHFKVRGWKFRTCTSGQLGTTRRMLDEEARRNYKIEKVKKRLENKKHKICQLKIDKILLTKRKNIQSLGIEKKMKYCWKIGNMLSLPRLWVDFETMDSTVWGQNWFISLSCWASSCTQWPLRSLPNFVCIYAFVYV